MPSLPTSNPEQFHRPLAAAALAIALLVAACWPEHDPAGRLQPSEPHQKEWIQLFNGTDLDDSTIKFAGHPLGENVRNTFRVEEGLLKVRYDEWSSFDGEFGHIFYKEPFSHYVVAVEYRFVGEQVRGAGPDLGWAVRNNGIMLHAQPAETMTLHQGFPISIEVQLLGGFAEGERTTANLCTPGTHVVMDGELITAHCVNSSSKTFRGDQWVRAEARVLGDSLIQHIVEGDTVMSYTAPQMGGDGVNDPDPAVMQEGRLLAVGYIALQAETAPVDFRKVEVLNLKGCMDPEALNYKSYFVKADSSACRYADQ